MFLSDNDTGLNLYAEHLHEIIQVTELKRLIAKDEEGNENNRKP